MCFRIRSAQKAYRNLFSKCITVVHTMTLMQVRSSAVNSLLASSDFGQDNESVLINTVAASSSLVG